MALGKEPWGWPDANVCGWVIWVAFVRSPAADALAPFSLGFGDRPVLRLLFCMDLPRVTSPACGRGRALRPRRGPFVVWPLRESPLTAEGTDAQRWSASDLTSCAVEVTRKNRTTSKGERELNVAVVER